MDTSDHITEHPYGVLLLNTGSSSAPEVRETRAYLKQFLSDPRIIDIPAWKRWLLVNLIILPFRPKRTAAAYKEIWTERGSPLIAISEDCRDALSNQLDNIPVALGMAYGTPSIEEGIDTLKNLGVDHMIVVPLFPQFASATTGAVLNRVYEYCGAKWNVPTLSVVPPFYDDPDYLDSWSSIARPYLNEFRPDKILFSFHGLPERQIYKADETGKHCLIQKNCCDIPVRENKLCYRRHCMITSHALVDRLDLSAEQYTVSFQSRLGRDAWLEPSTEDTIVKLAKEGVKRLAVLSPAFVADCLETLEELGMAAKEKFIEAGGEDFLLIPSLNTHPDWIDTLTKLVRQAAGSVYT